MVNCQLAESCLDSLRFLFVTGLVEESKHVALVVLYTRLVEGVNAQYITANTATLFEEIEQLTDVVFVELGHYDTEVGYTTINVSK